MIKSISAYIENIYKKSGYASILVYITPENSPVNSPVTSPAIPTRTPPNTPVTSPSTATTTPASTPGSTSGNTTGNIGESNKGEGVKTEGKTVDNKLNEDVKTEDITADNEVPVQGADIKEIVGSNTTNGATTSGNITGKGGSSSDDLLSPMDQFEIHPFLGNLLGLNYTPIGLITNILVYIGLVVSFIILFYIYGNFKDNIKLNGWSFSTEVIYFTIYNMVIGQIGSLVGLYFFVLIFVLFIYILFSNLVGLIPYNFATTAHLVSTLSMSSSIWFGVTIIGLILHALKFFTLFSPEGTPLLLVPLLALIELISYIAKGLSLGIRLGANLISGHLLLLILAGFGFLGLTATIYLVITGGLVAIALITAISGLELAIAGIQSYVYSILTSSYIKDSISLH
jgi:F-type H+-transporting ATPase subunit a